VKNGSESDTVSLFSYKDDELVINENINESLKDKIFQHLKENEKYKDLTLVFS
jgi:hypothetical protein